MRQRREAQGEARTGARAGQRALVEVFNAIHEEDFKGFTYGFQPKRVQHDALDALAVGITRTQV
jgi:hypothetical protein